MISCAFLKTDLKQYLKIEIISIHDFFSHVDLCKPRLQRLYFSTALKAKLRWGASPCSCTGRGTSVPQMSFVKPVNIIASLLFSSSNAISGKSIFPWLRSVFCMGTKNILPFVEAEKVGHRPLKSQGCLKNSQHKYPFLLQCLDISYHHGKQEFLLLKRHTFIQTS